VDGRGKCGFIDRTGTLVIPMQFEEAESFEKSKARVNLTTSIAHRRETF
jgi:hypothetical protein